MFILKSIRKFLRSLKADKQLWVHQKNNPTCRFYEGVKIADTTFEDYNTLFEDVRIANCVMGSHSYIQKRSTVYNADIGKFCSIATGVSIGPGIHKTDGISTHNAFYIQNTPLLKKYRDTDLYDSHKRVTIGHDVWIGERAIIMDGVKLGHGCIVAAGAVVTKDVAPYAMVGGVPAKVMKMRFDEDQVKQLLASEWWNRPEEWLSANHKAFDSIDQFLDNEKNQDPATD